MTNFFLKNRFTNRVLKNRFNITIKRVHTTCRNIKAFLRVIRLLYIYMIWWWLERQTRCVKCSFLFFFFFHCYIISGAGHQKFGILYLLLWFGLLQKEIKQVPWKWCLSEFLFHCSTHSVLDPFRSGRLWWCIHFSQQWYIMLSSLTHMETVLLTTV